MTSLLDRFKGAMVGVHVGDSLGAPYETWAAPKIATDIEVRGGLTFFDHVNPWKHEFGPEILTAGRPTDDSDQTADLAWSLIECNGLNTKHLREALRDSVVHHKSRLWDGTALGAGGTTKKALSDDPAKIAEALQNTIGTNGSLMRSVPMALWLYGKFGVGTTDDQMQARELMGKMSAVTHSHNHSISCCIMYAACLQRICNGRDYLKDYHTRHRLYSRHEEVPGPLYGLFGGKIQDRLNNILTDPLLFPIDPGAWPARGTAEFSLYTAMWCFLHSTSFEDGIEKAIRIGGDTDTYAAIAGGLLGAYYGYGAIPEKWKRGILGHDVMVEYAQRLYQMNQSA